jgi:hypothetical protein
MVEINWDEAPEGTNGHYLVNNGLRCWMKVGQPDERYQWCSVGDNGFRQSGIALRYTMLASNNWEKQFTPRPEKVERKNMELKEFKKTKAYEQLRKFIEVNVPDVEKRPAQLGIMVKRTMARIDPKYWYGENSDKSILWMGNWKDTPEGHNFWHSVEKARKVDNIYPCPIGKGKEAEKPAVKKEEKPNKVGWW